MLISCKECGKEISDKSEKCIHCGYSTDSYGRIPNDYVIIFWVVVLGYIFFELID